jgi:transposase-like protein
MDNAETDVLAYMAFPAPHRAKIHSTNPIERLRLQSNVLVSFPPASEEVFDQSDDRQDDKDDD